MSGHSGVYDVAASGRTDPQYEGLFLAKSLREDGWVVDIAATGEAGRDLASADVYDAIVLDWMLPDKDGLRMCRDLRARRIGTPILMLTAPPGNQAPIGGLKVVTETGWFTESFAGEDHLERILEEAQVSSRACSRDSPPAS